MEDKKTLSEVLGTDNPDEQLNRVNELLKDVNQPDIIVSLHYRPATRQIFFGVTAVTLNYDQLINLLSEGIKAASALKAQAEREEQDKK